MATIAQRVRGLGVGKLRFSRGTGGSSGVQGGSYFGSSACAPEEERYWQFSVFVSRLMGRREWSAIPVPEEWVQVVRPKLVQWPRASKDGKPQQPRQPTAGPWAPAAPLWSQGASHRHRRQGSGRRTPTRCPWWHLESFQTHFQNVSWRETTTWTNESGVGKNDGPLPETGVGASLGGGKTQHHRNAEQAQPVNTTGRVGLSRPGTAATLNELRDPERHPIVGGHPSGSQQILSTAPVRVGPSEARKQPPQCTESNRACRRHKRTFKVLLDDEATF